MSSEIKLGNTLIRADLNVPIENKIIRPVIIKLKKLKKLVGENVEITFETLDEKNEELMIKEGIGKNKKW